LIKFCGRTYKNILHRNIHDVFQSLICIKMNKQSGTQGYRFATLFDDAPLIFGSPMELSPRRATAGGRYEPGRWITIEAPWDWA
jgi:hypothetical protein